MRASSFARAVVALSSAAMTISPRVVRAAEDAVALHAAELRCEYLVDPLGINETAPRLSWVDESARRAERQSAYQILVASNADGLDRDAGDRWDSGKVASDETTQIAYAGKGLTSRAAAFWKVRVWNREGQPSAWSAPARWTMGLLSPADWQAKWIDASGPERDKTAGLTVERAVYGADDGTGAKDVTAPVTALLLDRSKEAWVRNDAMGGDPAPGHRKTLVLDATVAGRKIHASYPEGTHLQISGPSAAPKYLRKSFPVPAAVRQVTLYVTALGLYEATLNGQRVGNHVLAPDWTDYNRRVRYQAYDVTALVRPGENVLGALLANGWYAGHLGNGGFQQYGTVPALLAQLEITDADGRVERIVSDGTWKTQASPVTASDFMLGESYDARQELPGWDRPGFDAGAWDAATVRDEKRRALDAQVMPPVRATAERKPVAVTQPKPGHWTFDLGQNMVGVVHLKVAAPAGTVVTLRHAEMLNPDGTVYTKNLRGAPSVDTYTCRGGGSEEIWQPRFTFHGFRYVEVTGLTQRPADDAVTGIVLNTDDPAAGFFTCSDARVNQLVSNLSWGQRGNYLSVPTDCPQRDERLGWMGDAQVFVRTATDVADVAAFYTKWLVDVDDAQRADGAFSNVSPYRGSNYGSPAWGDAGVICPWTIYEAYGDRRMLQIHLPAMTRWVEWCREHSTGLLRDRDRGSDYGDWLSIGADTPKDVIGTAYFAYSAHLVAMAYAAVGEAAAAAKYQTLFEDIRRAFDGAYIAPDGRIKGNTQCVYAMALRFELLPEELRPKAVAFLADDIAARGSHLSTGFVGVSYLLPALTAGGRLDTAYALLMQDTFPSWLFSVKHGATTVWERWDGWTPDRGFQDAGMNSFNHYSLGSCGEWLYDTAAGIGWDSSAPGYKKIRLQPSPGGGLTSVKAGLHTVHGQINSAWTVAGGTFTYEMTIPANTTATVVLPTTDATHVTESGRALNEVREISALPSIGGNVTLTVGSGTYRFTGPLR